MLLNPPPHRLFQRRHFLSHTCRELWRIPIIIKSLLLSKALLIFFSISPRIECFFHRFPGQLVPKAFLYFLEQSVVPPLRPSPSPTCLLFRFPPICLLPPFHLQSRPLPFLRPPNPLPFSMGKQCCPIENAKVLAYLPQEMRYSPFSRLIAPAAQFRQSSRYALLFQAWLRPGSISS